MVGRRHPPTGDHSPLPDTATKNSPLQVLTATLRQQAGWVLVFVVGLAAIRWWSLRGRPERVRDLRGDYLTVQSGLLLRAEHNDHLSRLWASPVQGGKERLLVERAARLRASGAQVTPTHYYYFEWEHDDEVLLKLGEKVISQRVPYVQLRRVALAGGSPETVRTGIRGFSTENIFCSGPNFVVTDKALYWVHRVSDDPVWRSEGGRKVFDHGIPRSVLMTAPLAGGNERPLVTGMPEVQTLTPGKQGVYWSRWNGLGKPQELSYVAEGEARPRLLGRVSGLWQPCEHAGRLYWIQDARQQAPPANGTRPGYLLMEASLDGSGVRSVATLSTNDEGGSASGLLFSHRDRLYLIRAAQGEMFDTLFSLYQVEPMAKEPLRTLLNLPKGLREGQYYFDGDYFYFEVTEERRSAWQYLKGTLGHPVNVLYRWHLPEKTGP